MDYNNLPKAFCVLPWMHTEIDPDSSVNLCCLTAPTPMGNLKDNTLKEIFHSPKYNEIRQQMLTADSLPKECAACTRYETSGRTSLRQSQNNRWKKFISLLEPEPSGHAEFKQLYLDYRFTNKCNFACIGCGEKYSSAHAVEDKRIKVTKLDSPIINVDGDKVLNEIKEFHRDIEKIYFAGGEPTIAEHHYELLQMFIDSQQRIELFYNTNFSHLTYKHYDLIDMWNKINGTIVLSVSVDGFDKWGEQLRYGLDAKEFASNVQTLLKRKGPHIQLQFTVTVGLGNYRMIGKISNWIDGMTSNNGCRINFGPMIYPIGLSTDVLTPAMREEAIREVEDLSENFTNPFFDHFAIAERRRAFKEFLAPLKNHPNHNKWVIVPQLELQMKQLDKKDTVRKTSWRENLPKLVRDMETILEYNRNLSE
jgi:MoaA/NifB/PqqE/SkfB family radical SAM enzyme